MRKLGSVVVVLAFGVASMLVGCSRDSHADGARATVPTLAATTSTTDPYAIPDTIDEAYVERVLAALNKIEGDAVREIVANEALVPAAAEKLKAVYLRDELNEQLRVWGEVIGNGELDHFRRPPGDLRVTVVDLRTRRPDCIFVKVLLDATQVSAQPGPATENYVALQPKVGAQDTAGVNPTPWMIALSRVSSRGAPPVDPCAG